VRSCEDLLYTSLTKLYRERTQEIQLLSESSPVGICRYGRLSSLSNQADHLVISTNNDGR
jgi:hypothetical protein